MESHGGYLARLDEVDPSAIVRLARRALAWDGVESLADVSLLISVIPSRRVVRVAFDATFTYGRRGAHWYEHHQAFARLASREMGTVVHAYVFDVDEMELVQSYGGGTAVGGERLLVEEFEIPDDALIDDDDDFERLKDAWPLGRLARIYGITRDELVRMPKYATSVLIDLDAPSADDLERLGDLLAPIQRAVGT